VALALGGAAVFSGFGSGSNTAIASTTAAAGGSVAVHSVATPTTGTVRRTSRRSRVIRRARVVRAATPLRNRLVGGAGLNTAVVYYSDCSGATPLTRTAAAIDTCATGRTYFVGHNPGVFTPLFSLGVGSVITWFDGAGTAHHLRVVAVETWVHTSGLPALVGGASVQFQTCITSDGSIDRILDAVAF
jgi:hypothetical protein